MPGLSPELIQKYYIHTSATAFGHLNRTRANLRSTQPNGGSTLRDGEKPTTDSPPTPKEAPTANLYLKTFRPTNENYSDASGDYIPGNLFFLVMYHYDLNLIHIEVPRDHTNSAYITAYNKGIEFYHSYDPSFVPQVETMDNIRGDEIKANLRKHGIKLALVPPNDHRTNKAERAVQTW
jgi:hypothetical protein